MVGSYDSIPVRAPERHRFDDDGTYSASYYYDRSADGSGNFQFTANGDIQNGARLPVVLEDLVIRSRWNATGAGRSDIKVSGGDLSLEVPNAPQVFLDGEARAPLVVVAQARVEDGRDEVADLLEERHVVRGVVPRAVGEVELPDEGSAIEDRAPERAMEREVPRHLHCGTVAP